MASNQHTSPLAIAYAQAVLELANERSIAEPIASDLQSLKAILTDHPTFGQFLANPAIGTDERAGVLERSLKDKVNPLLYDTVRLLNVRGRLGLLSEIDGHQCRGNHQRC
jgi:F-type H+-transporting ATPase subunit delta